MFKKIGLLLFSLLLLACSDNSLDLLRYNMAPEKVDQRLSLALTVDTLQQGIFEIFVFRLHDSTYTGDNSSITLPLKFVDTLDSLVWSVAGNNQKVELLKKSSGSIEFTTQWGHYFYLPGSYTTYIHGYSGNQIITADTVVVNTAVGGDFLNVKWNKPVTDRNIGYPNNGILDYEFQIFTSVRDGILFSKLNVHFEAMDYFKHNAEIGVRELEVLPTYITTLYGLPQYNEESADIGQVYKKLFRTDIIANQIIKIWSTETTNIALLRKETLTEDGFGYEIHAEPKQ